MSAGGGTPLLAGIFVYANPNYSVFMRKVYVMALSAIAGLALASCAKEAELQDVSKLDECPAG